MPMTNEEYLADLVTMVRADFGHLIEALKNGERVAAHRFVNAVIDNVREVEDLIASGITPMGNLERQALQAVHEVFAAVDQQEGT